MKNYFNLKSIIITLSAISILAFYLFSTPSAEGSTGYIAEQYILRYDVEDVKSIIEKITRNDDGTLSSAEEWRGPHDSGFIGDNHRNPIFPFYDDHETYLFHYVDDTGQYTIMKINPDFIDNPSLPQALEVLWSDPMPGIGSSFLSFFGIVNINDEPHIFSIEESTGGWQLNKIIVDEQRLQLINSGDWSSGWDNVVPFYLGGEPYLFVYRSAWNEQGGLEPTREDWGDGEWQIRKIINDGTGQTVEREETWSHGWQLFGVLEEIEPHIFLRFHNESFLHKINSDGTGNVEVIDDGPGFGFGTEIDTFTILGIPYFSAYDEDGATVFFYEIVYRGLDTGIEQRGTGTWNSGWDEIVPFLIWEPFCGSGEHLENGICVPNTDTDCPGGCMTTCAIFGSELAPLVQELRETRDNSVMVTQSGSSFMNTFLAIYYTFSPTIADWERNSPEFKEVVKIGITPMLLSLSLLNHVDIDSEKEMLGYGIGVILLNIGMYFVAPAIVIWQIKKNVRYGS